MKELKIKYNKTGILFKLEVEINMSKVNIVFKDKEDVYESPLFIQFRDNHDLHILIRDAHDPDFKYKLVNVANGHVQEPFKYISLSDFFQQEKEAKIVNVNIEVFQV